MSSDNQQQTLVVLDQRKGNGVGIACFVFGLLSIFFLSPIFVPIALVLGVIGLIKGQALWSILGLIMSLIGFFTSPILLGILGLATFGAVQ